MLRLTLTRVGPDGQATAIGRAVIGRWAGRHIAAVTDDRHEPAVGSVDGHDTDDGVWSLVRHAIESCLDGDGDLTAEQRRTLEQALQQH